MQGQQRKMIFPSREIAEIWQEKKSVKNTFNPFTASCENAMTLSAKRSSVL
jgi:hypothetical protein